MITTHYSLQLTIICAIKIAFHCHAKRKRFIHFANLSSRFSFPFHLFISIYLLLDIAVIRPIIGGFPYAATFDREQGNGINDLEYEFYRAAMVRI